MANSYSNRNPYAELAHNRKAGAMNDRRLKRPGNKKFDWREEMIEDGFEDEVNSFQDEEFPDFFNECDD